MRKTTILVVSSRSFSRAIEHLFRGRMEFEVVGSVNGLGSLGRQAGRRLPELIVANVKPVGIRICRVVASIKQFSPSSRLILICPVEDLASQARKCGADACLKDDRLAAHLLHAAQTLTDRSKMPGPVG